MGSDDDMAGLGGEVLTGSRMPHEGMGSLAD